MSDTDYYDANEWIASSDQQEQAYSQQQQVAQEAPQEPTQFLDPRFEQLQQELQSYKDRFEQLGRAFNPDQNGAPETAHNPIVDKYVENLLRSSPVVNESMERTVQNLFHRERERDAAAREASKLGFGNLEAANSYYEYKCQQALLEGKGKEVEEVRKMAEQGRWKDAILAANKFFGSPKNDSMPKEILTNSPMGVRSPQSSDYYKSEEFYNDLQSGNPIRIQRAEDERTRQWKNFL